MLRVLFVFLGNILLLPVNIILLLPRLAYKIIVNNKAAIWISAGGKKKILEVDGSVKVK